VKDLIASHEARRRHPMKTADVLAWLLTYLLHSTLLLGSVWN
jgi:hypothetical protein